MAKTCAPYTKIIKFKCPALRGRPGPCRCSFGRWGGGGLRDGLPRLR